jgi:hypothetical protein
MEPKSNYNAKLEALKAAWEAFKDQDWRGFGGRQFSDIDRWLDAFSDTEYGFIVVTYDSGEYITNTLMDDDEDTEA